MRLCFELGQFWAQQDYLVTLTTGQGPNGCLVTNFVWRQLVAGKGSEGALGWDRKFGLATVREMDLKL